MIAPWRRQRRDLDLDEELAGHLRMAIEERVARGERREDAERTARREFGNLGVVKEVTREMWGGGWLERLWQDVRYGVRTLRRSPAFTIVALSTLALGIGATTAMFTVVHAVLLRPLPYPRSDRLMRLAYEYPQSPFITEGGITDRQWVETRSRYRAFTRVAAVTSGLVTLTNAGDPVRLQEASVAAGLFETLGVTPALGRSFGPDDEQVGGEWVVILSDALWRERLDVERVAGDDVVERDVVEDRRLALTRIERRHERTRGVFECAECPLSLLRSVLHFRRVCAGKRRRARDCRAVDDREVQRDVMELDAPAPCALGGRGSEHREAIAFGITHRTATLLDIAKDVLQLHDLRVSVVPTRAQRSLEEFVRELALRLGHRLDLQTVALELRHEVPAQTFGRIKGEGRLLALLRGERRQEIGRRRCHRRRGRSLLRDDSDAQGSNETDGEYESRRREASHWGVPRKSRRMVARFPSTSLRANRRWRVDCFPHRIETNQTGCLAKAEANAGIASPNQRRRRE